MPLSDIIRGAKLAVSGGSIIKQVKGTGSKIPVPKTQQPAEPTANAGFGGLRLRGQISGVGVGFKVCFSRNTDECKNLSGVGSVGQAKKGGF